MSYKKAEMSDILEAIVDCNSSLMNETEVVREGILSSINATHGIYYNGHHFLVSFFDMEKLESISNHLCLPDFNFSDSTVLAHQDFTQCLIHRKYGLATKYMIRFIESVYCDIPTIPHWMDNFFTVDIIWSNHFDYGMNSSGFGIFLDQKSDPFEIELMLIQFAFSLSEHLVLNLPFAVDSEGVHTRLEYMIEKLFDSIFSFDFNAIKYSCPICRQKNMHRQQNK